MVEQSRLAWKDNGQTHQQCQQESRHDVFRRESIERFCSILPAVQVEDSFASPFPLPVRIFRPFRQVPAIAGFFQDLNSDRAENRYSDRTESIGELSIPRTGGKVGRDPNSRVISDDRPESR